MVVRRTWTLTVFKRVRNLGAKPCVKLFSLHNCSYSDFPTFLENPPNKLA